MRKQAVIGIMLICATFVGAETIIVGFDSPYKTIQAGLEAAKSGDEVVVLDDVYMGPGNRNLTIPVDFIYDVNGTFLAAEPRQITLRSANGPAWCIIDCNASAEDPHSAFSFLDEDPNTVIEGFTIRNAYKILEKGDGGAMLIRGSNITIRNCLFINNVAPNGGAILASESPSNPFCKPLIENCTFWGNSADSQGGALYCGNNSHPELINCILWGNSATEGQEIAMRFNNGRSNLTVQYCNIAGGREGIFDEVYPRSRVAWDDDSNISVDPRFADPNFGGENTFIQGDFHLKSRTGRWDAAEWKWVTEDSSFSPCIDAGSPLFSAGKETWPNGLRINMGAFGGTGHASRSPEVLANLLDPNNPEDPVPNYLNLQMDLTGDWLVDDNDFGEFDRQSLLIGITEPLAADFDESGKLDGLDRARIEEAWQPDRLPPEPPLPFTMAWESGPNWVADFNQADDTETLAIPMTAVTAFSTDGTGVEYWFEDKDNNRLYNSGWLSFALGETPGWVDDFNLKRGVTYNYRVRTRNRGDEDETRWSAWSPVVEVHIPRNEPPTPNPLQWIVPPKDLGGGSIYMEVVPAEANNPVSGVEYMFTCLNDIRHSSDWLENTHYEVGVTTSGTYTFVAKARDKSNLLETKPTGSVNVEIDVDPIPNPSLWLTKPEQIEQPDTQTSGGFIKMEAVPARAKLPGFDVQYRFICSDFPTVSSDWQNSPLYELEVAVETTYTFHVVVRDQDPNDPNVSYNQTESSSEESVIPDLTPPTPDRMEWAVKPHFYDPGAGTFDIRVAMTAETAEDRSGLVEYLFLCSDARFSSAWQESSTYDVEIGNPIPFQFQVKARDAFGNETEWSTVETARW